MLMTFIVKIIAQQKTLNFVINSVGVVGDKYISVDPKFMVTNTQVAHAVIQAVLKGLVDKNTFGTGWQILTRKYPASRVLDDYIIMFDPS